MNLIADIPRAPIKVRLSTFDVTRCSSVTGQYIWLLLSVRDTALSRFHVVWQLVFRLSAEIIAVVC